MVLYALGWAALPVRGAWKRVASADPAAMTVGCEDGACCTSRCYLDEHGAHHCVPREGASCDCGLSSGNEAEGAVPVLEIAVLPAGNNFARQPSVHSMIRPFPVPVGAADLAVPNPPPRSALRPFAC